MNYTGQEKKKQTYFFQSKKNECKQNIKQANTLGKSEESTCLDLAIKEKLKL